jgi:hypothetical protein
MKGDSTMNLSLITLSLIILVAVGCAGPDDAGAGLAIGAGLTGEGRGPVADQEYDLGAGDFRDEPGVAEGGSEEALRESRRLRQEMAGREPLPADVRSVRLPPSEEERRTWAAAATEEEGERVRRRVAAGFPEERVELELPDAAACSRYCDKLTECNGDVTRSTHPVCMGTCERGEFGARQRIDEALDLDSCEYL